MALSSEFKLDNKSIYNRFVHEIKVLLAQWHIPLTASVGLYVLARLAGARRLKTISRFHQSSLISSPIFFHTKAKTLKPAKRASSK